MLIASNIFAGYGETEILHDVSVEIQDDDFVTIIGPNGSGKSTLMKTIFGLIKPTSGKVILDNQDVTSSSPEQLVHKGLSYVPQSGNVFQSLTIHENLEMGSFIHSSNAIEQSDRMYSIFPDLYTAKNKKAGSLSGGQRQMLAFARAMMLNPRLLLLDEPSAGLAPAIVDLVFEKIFEIHKTGVSILLIEQNARKALNFSKTGYVLVNGSNRLKGIGPELLNDPEVARLYLGG
jgi:ABC-type branched-subunit amino acid transport system ATPase component